MIRSSGSALPRKKKRWSMPSDGFLRYSYRPDDDAILVNFPLLFFMIGSNAMNVFRGSILTAIIILFYACGGPGKGRGGTADRAAGGDSAAGTAGNLAANASGSRGDAAGNPDSAVSDSPNTSYDGESPGGMQTHPIHL